MQACHKHGFGISKSKVVSFKVFVFMHITVFLKVSRTLKLFRMHKLPRTILLPYFISSNSADVTQTSFPIFLDAKY